MAMRILGDNPPINNAAAAGEAFSCATIVWSSALGVYFSFEKADPAALLRAGIFTSEELPGERYMNTFSAAARWSSLRAISASVRTISACSSAR